MRLKRREFVKTTALGAAAVALGGARALHAAKTPPSAKMPQRPFRPDGPRISAIGFPGLVLRGMKQEAADKLVADSIAAGITYFDVAPAYGNAEQRLGPALEPYRKDVFLACKTKQRTAERAKVEFERSLEHLRTDRFDLYQLHVLQDVRRDVEAAFADGGVMEYLLAQRKAGRVRYLGFSAHTEAAAVAALERFAFDSVMIPVNLASWEKGGFGEKTLAAARKRGATVLAIKGLCRQRWPKDDPARHKVRLWYQPVTDRDEAVLHLRFTFAKGATAAVGPSYEPSQRLAMAVGAEAAGQELSDDELARAKALAGTLNPLFPH